MSIKTNELQQVTVMEDSDRLLADTANFGTAALTFGKLLAQTKERLTGTIQSEAREQQRLMDSFESGTVSIVNNQPYPFCSGMATVALAIPRKNLNYVIDVEIESAAGNVQRVEVYDKALNGFKIRYDGSASSAAIKYFVTGGMQ